MLFTFIFTTNVYYDFGCFMNGMLTDQFATALTMDLVSHVNLLSL